MQSSSADQNSQKVKDKKSLDPVELLENNTNKVAPHVKKDQPKFKMVFGQPKGCIQTQRFRPTQITTKRVKNNDYIS